MKKIYKVPVDFVMYGVVEVEASSPEEAFEKALAPEVPLPDEKHYVDDSFRVSMDKEEWLQTYGIMQS